MSPFPDDPTRPPLVPEPSATPEPPVVQKPPVWSAPQDAAPSYAAPEAPLNPWTAIFTRPRAVMRQILDRDPSRHVHRVALGAGVLESLGIDTRMLSHVGIPLGAIVAVKVMLGALGGLLFLYLGSGLLLMTGRWCGGRGSFVEVRSATAWSNVPVYWSALLWLPLVGYLGLEAFNLDVQALRNDPVGLLLLVPFGLVGFVLVIWRIVIYCKCLGEAHRFSAWRSLGAALLACLLAVVSIAILTFTIVTIGGHALLGRS